MKNTLTDLNNHLFAELERLGDEELTEEELEKEIKRAQSIANISGKVIDNANLVFQAAKFKDDRLDINSKLPRLLGE